MRGSAILAGWAGAMLLAGCEVAPLGSDAGGNQQAAGNGAAMTPGAFESVFTNLDLAQCATIRHAAKGGDRTLKCLGYEAVPLLVREQDGRIDIDAGTDNQRPEALGAPARLGPNVEWRLHDGKPVAIILRFAAESGRRILAIESVSGRGAPGCELGRIDGGLPHAGALARDLADRFGERFRCGQDAPERRGQVS